MQLAVDVGDVHQRDVADGIEPQQLGLREPLLRESLRDQPAGTSAAVAAATWRNSRLEIISAPRIAHRRARMPKGALVRGANGHGGRLSAQGCVTRAATAAATRSS